MTSPAESAARLVEALKTAGVPIAGAGVSTGDDRAAVVEPREHTHSRFEIGSITKKVTGLVLARLVLDGAASLDQPVGTWLDGGANGHITLEQLATHSSGLPRLGPNHFTHKGYDEGDPYAAFTADLAEEGLRNAEIATPGKYLYSNFGYQLLGMCLERITGRPLAELFAEVVFAPLGMAAATLDADAPVLQGVDDDGALPNWTLQLHGPGGINAPIGDLLLLADAFIRPPDDEFAAIVKLATEPRQVGPGADVGLGCLIADGVVCGGGGTAGFSTFIAADRGSGKSVALAANRQLGELVQSCAFAAVRGQDPMAVVPQPFDGDPGPASDLACRFFTHFARDDFAGARTLMLPKTAEVLTEERMRPPWASLVEQCGTPSAPEVQEVAREGTRIRVTLQANGEKRPLTMVVWLEDDLQVSGVVIR